MQAVSTPGSLRSDPFKEGARTPGELWRIEGEGKVTEMYGNVGLTNGIGFSPDGKIIYHADSAGPHLIVHDVDARWDDEESSGDCADVRRYDSRWTVR